MNKSPRIFFGWWTVIVMGIISGFGHGFYSYGFSVFFKDLAAELGLSRAVTSVAAGIGRIEGGITSPLTGWLADRYGPKGVVFTGICLAGSGMILMYSISSVGAYILVWGVIIGVGLNIGLTVAVDKALNDWFLKKLGLAQGTKFALIGAGSLALLPIVTVLVIHCGWRKTCLIWGIFLLACAPLALVFVKQKRPEYYGLLPDGEKGRSEPSFGRPQKRAGEEVLYAADSQEGEFTFRQAIGTRAYWLLTAAFGVQQIIAGGLYVHTIPFLTDIGIDRVVASGMMGMIVFFMIPARFLAGLFADRVGKERLALLLAAGFFIQAVGIAIFLISRSTMSVTIFFVLYGLSSGASLPLFIITLGRFFGRKAFGAIFGCSMAIRAPGSLLAPVFTGWIFDRTGSYFTAFTVFAALSVIACILMFPVRPVHTPERSKGDITQRNMAPNKRL